MKFNKRSTTPAKGDKNYIQVSHGGYNYAMNIYNGDVLPNCVGYAWGRWRELLGAFHNLSRANAEDWWGKKDGYARSQMPVLGSVICWSLGKPGVGYDGAGHVAIVEEVKSDGTIVTSNSAYKGQRFYLRELKPPYNLGAGYKLQGFIHPPVKFTDSVVPPKSNAKLAEEVKLGKWGNGSDRVNRLKAAGYDPVAVQSLVNGTTKPVLKTPSQIADEIYRGKGGWGNGSDRVNRLKAAGYDPKEVQRLVNAKF